MPGSTSWLARSPVSADGTAPDAATPDPAVPDPAGSGERGGSDDAGPGGPGGPDAQGVQGTQDPLGTEGAAGADAATAALNRARGAARDRGLVPGTPPRGRGGARSRRSPSGTPAAPGSDTTQDRGRIPGTGPGFPPPPGRDPRPLADTLDTLVSGQGWRPSMSVGGVIGRWPDVVGPEIAAHAMPETFVDGRLVVRTTSTAWATQLGLLLPQLERRLAEEVGEGVVAEIVVIGPGAPSWVRGPRVVRGRGPRDTYG